MSKQTLVDTPDTHTVDHTANADLQTRTRACTRRLWQSGIANGVVKPGMIAFGVGPYLCFLRLKAAGHYAIEHTMWRATNEIEYSHAINAAKIVEQSVTNAKITIEKLVFWNVTATVEFDDTTQDAFIAKFHDHFNALRRVITAFGKIMRATLPCPPKYPLPITTVENTD